MQRFLIAVTAALLITVLTSQSALAGTKWCVVDPVLSVDGRVSDVTVSFAEAHIPFVTPPVVFVFHVPSNAKASLTLPPAPVAYTVELRYDLPPRLKRDAVTVTVDTLVPATVVFETQTVVQLPRGVVVAVKGASNATTTITYSVR